ncbi:MAG: hypothetical protein PGN33_23535 [Methylobacterium radiotolerans]
MPGESVERPLQLGRRLGEAQQRRFGGREPGREALPIVESGAAHAAQVGLGGLQRAPHRLGQRVAIGDPEGRRDAQHPAEMGREQSRARPEFGVALGLQAGRPLGDGAPPPPRRRRLAMPDWTRPKLTARSVVSGRVR